MSELENLRSSEERYRAFVQLSSEGIWCCELEQPVPVDLPEDEQIDRYYEQGFLVECNDAMARMYGLQSAGELLGARLADLLPRTDPANVEYLRAFIRSGYRLADAESHEVSSDGASLYFLNNLTGVVHEGMLLRAWGVQRDITDQKELKQELHRRLQELAEADRHKDEFLAMLSHELRNPLAGIANATYLLDRTGETASQLSELRSLIQRQTGYLSRLVDDLLDVSRLTRGLVELQLTPLDLRAVVEQAVEAGRTVVESRRHQLTLRLPDTPLPMRADPIRVEQIVLNLLFNAAKYTEPGGQVWVEVEGTAGTAVIRVRDTGMGIEPQLLRRIFDLFTQADRSYARTHGGLGIGLALVQRLVLLHGGEVEARSAGLGQGSEFEVRFPLVEGVLPAVAPAVPGPEPPRHRRVLIIEDDRDAAETLGEILELSGHEVALAFTGPQGLETAHRFQPEVILCDIGLPGMDGWSVARELRAAPETRHTRLIALTGFGLPDDRRRTFEAGFDRHLTKPVDLPELERLVNTI